MTGSRALPSPRLRASRMALRPEDLAKTIEHTLLDEDATPAAIECLCDEARSHHVATVCVPPGHVDRAAELLRGDDVKVAALVGFPAGAASLAERVASVAAAIAAGADELDLVLNESALTSGDFRLVYEELSALVRTARLRSVNRAKGQPLLKVVADLSLLQDKAQRLVCRLIERSGADFAVVPLGPGSGAARFHEIELAREYLPERVGVKAWGAVATLDEALALVNAGAGRIGTAGASGIMDASVDVGGAR